MEKAISILEEHISEIHSVSEWAGKMGYSGRKYFTRKVRAQYNRPPYEIIVEKKIERIEEEIKKSGDDIFFSIALELGFADHNSLYKFVKRHTGKTLIELRKESQKGESKRRVKKESQKGESKRRVKKENEINCDVAGFKFICWSQF